MWAAFSAAVAIFEGATSAAVAVVDLGARDNRRMRVATSTIAGLAILLLAACDPTFNWRETPIAASSLVTMFPCKPQKMARPVVFGALQVEMHMTTCDTAGVTVAVAHASISDRSQAGPILAQWRNATLAGMRASSSTVSALQLEHSDPLPQSVAVRASGVRPDGRAVAFRGAWFARETELFAALMYSDKPNSEVADTFFSGLKLR